MDSAELPRLQGKPLFSFVVVADTHVNESDEKCSSPYETNRLANERARHVFQDIAAMDPPPQFVIHLGDIVHPVPSLPTFHDAVACFKDIVAPVKVPVHLLPGNHDVGDKRVDWMPADQVCAGYIDTYRAAFGPDYHAFDAGGLRFILINSLLLNSGLEEEQKQRAWIEEQIATAGGLRVFMFMHYPPYIYRTDERSNYDNVDEPARTWLLAQMANPKVEAVFAGHVHNFWYDRVGGAEFYMLPSTAFLRHDFSEFYRVAPGVEFGRGDAEKFGYFVVDVYADGHVAYSVRTMGGRVKAGEQMAPPAPRHLAHPKTSSFTHVGVELRHPWAESMQITATGGVQEFGRKWARNDYPLLALWEMGARLSKVTDLDLIEAEPRARMQLLARLGHRYIVTTLGAPKTRLYPEKLADAGVEGFEVNLTLDNFARQKAALREVRQATGTSIWFSKILTYDGSHFDGKHFNHFVKAGFAVDELGRYGDLLRAAREAGEIDGITVRLEASEALLPAARRMMVFAGETGIEVLASLKLSGPSLAFERAEDRANVANTALAMLLSKTGRRVRYVFDTFMDVDRGYYPRHAFIDRRFNPRPAAQAFATLNALFSTAPDIALGKEEPGALGFAANGQSWQLLTGEADTVIKALARMKSRAWCFDLAANRETSAAGQIAALDARQSQAPGELQVVLARVE